MLFLLNHWKNYLLIILLIANGLLYYQKVILDGKLQSCNADVATKQAAINLANELKEDLARKLRVREQEAAKAHAETQRRMEYLKNAPIRQDCEGAIADGIRLAHP